MQGEQFSAVLPIDPNMPMKMYMQERAYRDQQAQLQQEQQRYAEMRDLQMAKYLSDELDFANFATGTPLDPVISSSIEQAKATLVSMIKDGVPASQIVFEAANNANNIGQFSLKAKTIRAQIEEGAKQFSKNPSLDAIALEKGAIVTAFFKKDPKTGEFVIRRPEELDAQQDYVGSYLDAFPQLVVKGTGALTQLIEAAPKKKYEREQTIDKGGVKRTSKYEGQVSSFNVLYDEKGNIVDDPNGIATSIGVRSQKIKIGDKEIDIATPDQMQYFLSDPGARAVISVQVKQLSTAYPDVPPEILTGRVIYEYIQANNPGFLNKTKDVVDDSQLQSQMFRREMREQSIAIVKALRENKLEGSNSFEILGAAASGDFADGEFNEDGYQEVTPYLKNATLYSGRVVKKPDGTSSKTAYSGVFAKGGKLYTKDIDFVYGPDGEPEYDNNTGKPKTTSSGYVEIQDPYKWSRQIAQANGVSPSKAEESFRKRHRPIPSPQLNAMQEADQRLQQKKQEEKQERQGLYGWWDRQYSRFKK